MKKYRLFFVKDEDLDTCYTKSEILTDMKINKENQLKVYGGKIMRDYNLKWCKEFGIGIEKGVDYCGKNDCKFYSPRNGKNGCCKNLGFCYEPEREFILHSNGKLETI